MKYIIANLKSSMLASEVNYYIEYINQNLLVNDNIILAPSYLYLNNFKQTNRPIAAQNMFHLIGDNYTSQITVTQLKESQINYVILGHSEVREFLNESNQLIYEKIRLALKHNIKIILCIGENAEQRVIKHTERFIYEQLKLLLNLDPSFLADIIIAYEPIWAIGTGLTPTNQEIDDAIIFIKNTILSKKNVDINVLYGGSVNLNNIGRLNEIASCDGFLVGKASYDPKSLVELVDNLYCP